MKIYTSLLQTTNRVTRVISGLLNCAIANDMSPYTLYINDIVAGVQGLQDEAK